MGMNFPDTPALNQVHGSYTWDGEKWVFSPTGGVAVLVAVDPPVGAADNSLWWESDTGILYMYYNDGNSKQWVAVMASGSDPTRVSKAGDVMTGALELPAPTIAAHATNKGYVDTADALKVNKAGDTMTGALTSSANIQGLNVISSGGSLWAQNSANTGDVQFGTSGAKRLAFDGSVYRLYGGPFVNHTIDTYTGADGVVGTYHFGNTGTKYLSYDGSNFSLNGGALYLSGSGPGIVSTSSGFAPSAVNNASLVANGAYGGGLTFQDGAGRASIWAQSSDLYLGAGSPSKTKLILHSNDQATNNYIGHRKYLTIGAGSYYDSVSGADRFFAGTDGGSDAYRIFAAGVGGNALQIAYAGRTTIAYSLTVYGEIAHVTSVGGTMTAGYGYQFAFGGTTQWGFSFRPANDSSSYSAIAFGNVAGTQIGAISCSSTATAYNTASSGELKEDFKSFDAGRIIDDTEVYDFKWRATGERSYGVIAQQAIEVYPLAVSHLINPQDKDDEFWGVDYSKYVPVLLQELKALRTRVAELETKLEAKAKS